MPPRIHWDWAPVLACALLVLACALLVLVDTLESASKSMAKGARVDAPPRLRPSAEKEDVLPVELDGVDGNSEDE